MGHWSNLKKRIKNFITSPTEYTNAVNALAKETCKQSATILRQLEQTNELLDFLRGDYAAISEAIQIPQNQRMPKMRNGYTLAGRTIDKLLRDYSFQTVLDVGCGGGQHTSRFLQEHKEVYTIDIFESDFIREHKDELHAYIGDFNTYPFDRQFDCVWASHVLEHQLNVNVFLKKIHSVLKEDGVLAISVPPPKAMIVGGHVTVWNAGLLLYNLILAGFDCREASVLRYGYNLSVLVRKKTIDVLGELKYDQGDIRTLEQYFPKDIPFVHKKLDNAFDGDIERLNWDDAE